MCTIIHKALPMNHFCNHYNHFWQSSGNVPAIFQQSSVIPLLSQSSNAKKFQNIFTFAIDFYFYLGYTIDNDNENNTSNQKRKDYRKWIVWNNSLTVQIELIGWPLISGVRLYVVYHFGVSGWNGGSIFCWITGINACSSGMNCMKRLTTSNQKGGDNMN